MCKIKTFKVSDDYRALMSGNTEDCFRLGVAIAKKCLKLYTPFEKSDCVIASPLGLRMIVGDTSSTDRETDFLASIEILIIYKVWRITAGTNESSQLQYFLWHFFANLCRHQSATKRNKKEKTQKQ